MSQPPDIDISADQWAIVQAILEKNVSEHEVWAFGSRARKTAKPYSDLDLVILAPTPLSLAKRAALADEFSESELPWKVDVVDWASIEDSFKQIIAQDKVMIKPARNTIG